MAGGGFAFGLFANKRPLGNGILVHPLVLFFVLVAVALLVLRDRRSRARCPRSFPTARWCYGCCAGLVLFLIGNFFAAHALGLR